MATCTFNAIYIILYFNVGSSPVRLDGLSTGKHILKVVPSECGQNKMNLKTEIIIA